MKEWIYYPAFLTMKEAFLMKETFELVAELAAELVAFQREAFLVKANGGAFWFRFWFLFRRGLRRGLRQGNEGAERSGERFRRTITRHRPYQALPGPTSSTLR